MNEEMSFLRYLEQNQFLNGTYLARYLFLFLSVIKTDNASSPLWFPKASVSCQITLLNL